MKRAAIHSALLLLVVAACDGGALSSFPVTDGSLRDGLASHDAAHSPRDAATAESSAPDGSPARPDASLGTDASVVPDATVPDASVTPPPTTCSDKIKNQNETDVDCGGVCADCANGRKCSIASDCSSGYCNASKLCANPPPTCSDKIRNQNETDVDCGGVCADCANGKACKANTDCGAASYCTPSKLCAPKPPLTGTVIFSPSPRQADHATRYDASYDGSWTAVDEAFDMLNLHAADIWTRSDAYLQKIKARVGNKPIVLELQSTAGLLHFGLESTGSCNPSLDQSHARQCGFMAADAWYNGGSGGLGLHRLKNQGLNVKYIMLDSAFYAPYRQLLYFNQNGALHTAAGSAKAIAFMDGFIARLRASDKFGSGLKFFMISHFKYEYVAGNPGFRNRADGKTCFNTCFTGAKWNDEDAVVGYVLDKLPGRFDMVLFDASWSSFYATAKGWSRWDKMISVVKSRGVKVGSIVMSDADLAQNCGHDECWFSTSTACVPADEKTWWVHNMSYVDTILNGNGLITNYPQIDAMMVASWHRLPRSTFKQGNVCSIPMEDILRCAAHSLGRVHISCPTH